MLPRDDTIAAIATAGGAIGIVRVSGARAAAIAEAVLRGAPALESHRARRCIAIDAQGARVDEVLAILMRAPRSYTGEDVLELQGHGGNATTERLLALVQAAGARPAEPGEFTRRAFAAGRLSLLQAEAVAEVIAARGASAARLAQEGLAGTLDAVLEGMAAEVLGVLAEVVAFVDFPEEDLAPLDRSALQARVDLVAGGLAAAVKRHEGYRVGRDGAEVAIVGLPNAGKSSLFNALLGRERALVSERPGTTRDVLEAQVVWEGQPIVLLDTAGEGEPADELERRGIALGRARAEGADLRLVLVDGTCAVTVEEARLVDAQRGPRLEVRAKCDLPMGRAAKPGDLGVSSRSGEGLEGLRRAVLDALGVGRLGDDALVPQTARQRDAMARAATALEQASARLSGGAPLELVVLELEVGRSALLEVRGIGATDDVLEVVFREFCIGK